MQGINFSLPGLRDKRVLMTGGSTGIGREIVRAFARQYAQVTFLDIDEAGAQATIAACLADEAREPTFVHCDLTKVAELEATIKTNAQKNGSTQILVNNAANDDRHAWGDITSDYWDGRIAVNLRHVFFATQAVLPAMKAAGQGCIINMGSDTPGLGLGGMPIYSAAKAAIAGLTRSTAKEFGAFGIRVNSVIPGAIATERQKQLWYTPETVAEIQAAQCIKGEIAPSDVANMVVFLASDAAAMCTAQSYTVDAGWL